jgi:septum formation protein
MKLILASNSPYKRAQLDSLQLEYDAVNPEVDENHDNIASCDQHAIQLAKMKAEAVFKHHPDAIIIGSDQTAALETGDLLTKPHTFRNAVQQLKLCCGKDAIFYSAVCILSQKFEYSWLIETKVTFRALSQSEITRYVEKDSPLDCAGSFKVESLGISLFEKITSTDPTALVGLPLISLSNQLRKHAIMVP